jgi:hypothetical protein
MTKLRGPHATELWSTGTGRQLFEKSQCLFALTCPREKPNQIEHGLDVPGIDLANPPEQIDGLSLEAIATKLAVRLEQNARGLAPASLLPQ